MVKTREGYHGGLRLPYLVNLLQLTTKPISFINLLDEAMMHYKAGHLKYMRWLIEKKYVKKIKFTQKGLHPSETYTEYKITPRGKLLLELIK